MEKQIENLTEKFELDEEMQEVIKDCTEIGLAMYNRSKRRRFMNGFVIGVLTAVSIQSIITILILLAR